MMVEALFEERPKSTWEQREAVELEGIALSVLYDDTACESSKLFGIPTDAGQET